MLTSEQHCISLAVETPYTSCICHYINSHFRHPDAISCELHRNASEVSEFHIANTQCNQQCINQISCLYYSDSAHCYKVDKPMDLVSYSHSIRLQHTYFIVNQTQLFTLRISILRQTIHNKISNKITDKFAQWCF